MHIVSWRKIQRLNNKGMSSIVGAIFMILIIGVLASAYFVFTLAQNSSYNDAVKNSNQITLMQTTESIKVPTAPTYTQNGNNVAVTVTLQNDGPIGVNITTLWVESSTDGTTNPNYGFAIVNQYLSPGESYPLTDKLVISQNGQINSANCFAWVITARGRTFELYPNHGIGLQGVPGPTGQPGPTGLPGPTGDPGRNGATWFYGTAIPPNSNTATAVNGDFYLNTVTNDVYNLVNGVWTWLVNIKGSMSYDANTALVAQGIGSITLDFTNLTVYYLVGPQVNGCNTTMGPGMSGYNFYMGKTGPSTASTYKTGFSVNLTNMNPTGTIYLNSSSVFFSVMPYVKTGSQSVEAAAWYVVNVNQTTRVISQSYSRIELPYNVSTRVYFFAKDDIIATPPFQYSDGGTLVAPTTTPINLALIGNIIDIHGVAKPFGQNLPFVSIYVNG